MQNLNPPYQQGQPQQQQQLANSYQTSMNSNHQSQSSALGNQLSASQVGGNQGLGYMNQAAMNRQAVFAPPQQLPSQSQQPVIEPGIIQPQPQQQPYSGAATAYEPVVGPVSMQHQQLNQQINPQSGWSSDVPVPGSQQQNVAVNQMQYPGSPPSMMNQNDHSSDQLQPADEKVLSRVRPYPDLNMPPLARQDGTPTHTLQQQPSRNPVETPRHDAMTQQQTPGNPKPVPKPISGSPLDEFMK